MKQQKPKLYVEDPSFRMEKKFLEEQMYGKALESMVNVCADIVPINKKQKTIFLAKRGRKPLQGRWWWIGGRIFAGEREEDAAVRKLKQETSLEVSQDRLEYVAMYRYWLRDRAQEPQNKGTDSLAYTFAVELSSAELEIVAANLDPDEYNPSIGLEEFDRVRLIKEGVCEIVVDFYDRLFRE